MAWPGPGPLVTVPAETSLQASGPSFQVVLPSSAHVCPLQLLIPRVKRSGSVLTASPPRSPLSPAPRSSSPHTTRQPRCHPPPQAGPPASLLCSSLGSAPNKAPVSLFLSLVLCLLESRFRWPEIVTSSISMPWPNAWHNSRHSLRVCRRGEQEDEEYGVDANINLQAFILH